MRATAGRPAWRWRWRRGVGLEGAVAAASSYQRAELGERVAVRGRARSRSRSVAFRAECPICSSPTGTRSRTSRRFAGAARAWAARRAHATSVLRFSSCLRARPPSRCTRTSPTRRCCSCWPAARRSPRRRLEARAASRRVVACPAGRDGAHRLDNDGDEPARVLIVSTMKAPEINEMLEDGTYWVRDYAPGLTPEDPSLDVQGCAPGRLKSNAR